MAAAAATAADDDLGSADASLKTVDHSSAHSDSLHKHLDLEIACFTIKLTYLAASLCIFSMFLLCGMDISMLVLSTFL